MITRGGSLAFVTSMLALPLSAQPARAEEAGTGDQLQEIIVTAQHRQQSSLDVPSSIQVATGDQLENAGIRDLTSLQYTTPGFLPKTNSGFTQIFVRGIGNSIYVGADPSVATFVDDVPRIYGSMADNLVDVERVEVLKGAQGGLYGRNATGGVVNIITRQPTTDEAKGNLLLSYGEKNTVRTAAYLNLPLSDRIAWSVSAERDSHDAYLKNIAKASPYTATMFPSGSGFGTPQQTADFFNAGVKRPELNDQDFWAVKSKLLIKPMENFAITLAGDYADKHDNNGQGIGNVTPAYTKAALGGLFRTLHITTNFPAGFISTPGEFEVANGFDVRVFNREYGASATLVWNASSFDLTSISAYRDQRTDFAADAAVADVPSVIPVVEYPDKHYFYQELRAASTFAGPLHLLGGATYLDDHVKGETTSFLLSPTIPAGDTKIDQTVTNWSVYGQAAYDFTDHWTLAASGRYMHEENSTHFTKPVVSDGNSTEKKLVPSATLSYSLDEGTTYLRWARGFKTGGINIAVAPAYFPSPSDGSVFGPETVDTYEAGYHQALFDRKVQLTTAVFYNDYRDLQVSARGRPAYPAINTAVINAPSAKTQGVEAALVWRVVEPLTVGISAGYLDAKYKDFKQVGSQVLADFDRSGAQMPNAPKWQLSFNANLDQPLNDKLRLVSTLLVSHTSEVLYLASALPGTLPDAVAPGYWLANLRIGLRTRDDKYGFAVVADNLFNKAYYTYGNSTSLGNSLGWGSPRIIRGEIIARF